MAQKNKKVQKFNRDKLRAYMNKNGMTDIELSLSMGCSKNFLSNAIKSGYMTLSYYKLMCMMLNVEEDLFIEQEVVTAENDKGDNNLNTELLKAILAELITLNNNMAEFLKQNDDKELGQNED